jgi:hypothetical protein
MLGAPMFAALAIDVENIDDHRQRDLVVDSGVSLDWDNERTQRFLQEHVNALRQVAADYRDNARLFEDVHEGSIL